MTLSCMLSLFLQDKKMCFHTINVDNVILNIFQSLAFIYSSIRQLHIFNEQITIVSSPDPLRSRVCYFKLSPIDDPSSIIGFIVYRAVKLFSATNFKIEFNPFQHILVLCKKKKMVRCGRCCQNRSNFLWLTLQKEKSWIYLPVLKLNLSNFLNFVILKTKLHYSKQSHVSHY